MYEAEFAVRTDVARLRDRVAELERALADSRQREQALRENERRLQRSLVEAERAALRELSTSLIPIAEGLVLVPLVGTLDALRARQLLEALREGVGAHRASTVILDVTGVRIIDAAVASALVHASRVVGLLGAEVVLTGVRPEVTRTLLGVGADLGTLGIHGSLRSGIAHALGREAARGSPFARG